MAFSFEPMDAALLNTLGEDVMYQRAEVSDAFTLKAIVKADEDTLLRTRGAHEAFVQDSDFGTMLPVAGDELILAGTTYKVTDVRKAGAGASYLEIREKA